jgi:hypothetical protein
MNRKGHKSKMSDLLKRPGVGKAALAVHCAGESKEIQSWRG